MDSDQVFCPLQKKWVSRNPLPVAHYKNPLGEICSSDQRKEMFFFDLSKNLFSGFSSSHQTEEKFFKYLGEGKQIFTRITVPTDLPNRQITKLTTTEKSGAGNFQTDFTQKTVEAFSFAQLARPPTIGSNTKFDFQFALKLKNISRNINPRSPPTFI